MKEDIENVVLTDLECKHRIILPGYQGRSSYVFIFMDRKANTYFWVTSAPGPFIEGDIYDIKAKLEVKQNRLSYVKQASPSDVIDSRSEHVAKPDAEDILLGLASY